MYTINLYRHIKALLGRVVLDKNDAGKEILLVLHDIVLQLKDMKHCLVDIEEIVDLGSKSPGHIKVDTSHST